MEVYFLSNIKIGFQLRQMNFPFGMFYCSKAELNRTAASKEGVNILKGILCTLPLGFRSWTFVSTSVLPEGFKR